MECSAAQQALRERLGPEFSLAVIGPAGERLVRYATISHDGRHAGRGGSGAVLGSKNIKALAVRGDRRTDWAQPRQLTQHAREISARSFGPATAKYRELGTASNLLVFNRLGALPTRNFQQGSFAGAEAISPEQLSVARERTRASCAACTIGCEHIYSLKSGDNGGQGVRLEYENLFALGPLCGINDGDAILAASRRCDELGLDTISAGGTIAFAMECVERGWLDAPWLKFGDAGALERALEEIGRRQGLGELLAEGSRRAAAVIGHDSMALAPQVKGLEMPGYEPRALQTMALGLAVNARGADHNRSGAYEVDFSERVDRRQPGIEAAGMAIETEDRAALIDSLILCKFLRGIFDDLFASAAEMLQLVTGWDATAEELRTTARRIVTAKKLFNIRAGWQPAEDVLPERFFDSALPDDPRAVLPRERFDALVAAYNRGRGCDQEGWPDEKQLRQLELHTF
jgi:aldehyde:ferredoxin oxidoreductase